MTEARTAQETKPVVVGYDTSSESEVALEWAAVAAQRREARLIVVHATGWQQPEVTPQQAGVAELAQQAAREVAGRGAKRVQEIAPDLTVEAVGVMKGAHLALEEYSKDAQLVVIGNRGHGNLRSAVTGSVAYAVTTHAACPVVVVRAATTELPSPSHAIVVGVDGSEHSDVALDHAAELGARFGAKVRVVAAWSSPSWNPWSRSRKAQPQAAAADQNPWQVLYETDSGEQTSMAEEAPRTAAGIAQRAAARVQQRHPGLDVEQVVAEGRPSEVIVAAIREQSTGLVVVGARGRGDLASLLLGSVSRAVIHDAKAAVLVVR